MRALRSSQRLRTREELTRLTRQQALRTNTTLVKLTLDGNEITSRGCVSFVAVLEGSSHHPPNLTLEELSLKVDDAAAPFVLTWIDVVEQGATPRVREGRQLLDRRRRIVKQRALSTDATR